ncbi:MAG TPA: GNAT family N-acetyltransferase [Steroidobacteraceae bacterium]|jgi:RimJ/RimL family protein N-acetyltransferase
MIRDVLDTDLIAVRQFLEAHRESSLFLLASLAAHGPRGGTHPFSGTFRLAEEDGTVVAVFCLTRVGNLLVQAGGRAYLAEDILASSAHERPGVCGVVGEWVTASAIWKLLRADPEFQPARGAHEVVRDALYARSLADADADANPDALCASGPVTRILAVDDFPEWDRLNVAYMSELKLPNEMSAAQRKTEFESRAAAHRWWGLSERDELVAIAGLNAVYGSLGQVGGVYTRPEFRRRGLSVSLMRRLLVDCRRLHRFDRLTLFTGEDNVGARRVYESVGFEYLGAYGLLLGSRRARPSRR